MSEDVEGVVSLGNDKSSVVVVISGKASPKCLELLKMQLKAWAKRCGVSISSVRVQKKKAAKRRRK